MNNGQPPYGDPNAWNQQGNQVNPAQYPVQPNPYQQNYYQQPQQGYQQPQQQGYYQQVQPPVETYQQQAHPQQQVYQQAWQPYQGQPQQNYQQPQQYYGQQPYQQQPQQAYPQFNQMGQQVQQGYGSGYSGYYTQPAEKRFELPLDVVGKAVLFGVLPVLPVLFILAMIFSAPVLKWIFLAGAVGGIILMWMPR